jgi:hypothetical protein
MGLSPFCEGVYFALTLNATQREKGDHRSQKNNWLMSLARAPALTAPDSRGSFYLDESQWLEKEPRLSGAVQADF